MYAGGISYFSEWSFGFSCLGSPKAVAIDAIETSRINKVLADLVEDFMKMESR